MSECSNINCDNLVKRKGNKYCSHSCATKSNERVSLEKRKQTCLEKYGVEHPSQNLQIKEKIKQTNLEKYGYESHNSSEIIKEKKTKILLGKYGIKNVSQIEEVQEKKKQNYLDKYGVVYPFQNKEIQEKIKQKNLEKFGVENPAQNKEINNKIKQTNLDRYGVENPLQNKDIRVKVRKTLFKNTYFKLKEKFKDRMEFLFSLEDYGGTKDSKYNFKCLDCNSIFEGFLLNGLLPRCPICNPIIKGFSKVEKEVVDWLISLNINNVIERDKSSIPPYELDIYLPDYKIAIEFNGLYWHSEINGSKNKQYHLEKTEQCLEKEIQLIHIFEDEWLDKQEIIKSIILSKLGLCVKMYARDFFFDEVNKKIGQDFLEKNHLQGSNLRITHFYGLYYCNDLIQIIGIGKSRYNENYDYELIRSCTVLNTTVIGGFEKLMKNSPLQGSIISYVDRRYFNGNSYKNWEYIGKTESNYFYIKNHCFVRESRLKYQKHKLPKLFPDVYDINLTEWEIMQLAGYDRIWDCGNLVYKINLPFLK